MPTEVDGATTALNPLKMPPINISLDDSFPPLLFVFRDYFFFFGSFKLYAKVNKRVSPPVCADSKQTCEPPSPQ